MSDPHVMDPFIIMSFVKQFMTNISTCLVCGNQMSVIKHDNQITRFKISQAEPPLPPFSLFVCTKCGHWQMASLEIQRGGTPIPASEVPDQVKRDLGI